MPQVMKLRRTPLYTGTEEQCRLYMRAKGMLDNPKFTIVGKDPKSVVENNTLCVIKPNQVKRGFWKGIFDEL